MDVIGFPPPPAPHDPRRAVEEVEARVVEARILAEHAVAIAAIVREQMEAVRRQFRLRRPPQRPPN